MLWISVGRYEKNDYGLKAIYVVIYWIADIKYDV